MISTQDARAISRMYWTRSNIPCQYRKTRDGLQARVFSLFARKRSFRIASQSDNFITIASSYTHPVGLEASDWLL